ncbi:MAG: TadE/TadG family type IV pilus assembly protein [Hyphomicrobium sp.]
MSRWSQDERGTTAIEFGMVAVPFFLFAFAIMGIGLQFFTINSVEHGVEKAARMIRTGQMQNRKDALGNPNPYTNQEFKNKVCEEAGAYIDCDSHLVIHMDSANLFSDLSPESCVDAGGNLKASSGSSSDAITTKSGGANSKVLVTACYKWDLGGSMWKVIWKMLVTGGWSRGNTYNPAHDSEKVIIQAIATFQNEPY